LGRGNGSHNWAAGGTRPMSIRVWNVLYLQRTRGAPSPGSFHPPAALKEEPEIELAHFLIAFANAWLLFEFRGAPLFPQQRNLRSASGDGIRYKTRALCTGLTITSLVRPIAGKDNAVRNEDFRTNHEFSATFFFDHAWRYGALPARYLHYTKRDAPTAEWELVDAVVSRKPPDSAFAPPMPSNAIG